MELHRELPTAGGVCDAQRNVGGKILLESSRGETTVALMLIEISSWLPVSPLKLATGGWERPGRSAPQRWEACVCLGELCSPSGYCKSTAEGEETAVQALSGLLIPFTFRKLVGEW